MSAKRLSVLRGHLQAQGETIPDHIWDQFEEDFQNESQQAKGLEIQSTSSFLYASSAFWTYWKMKWIEDIPGYSLANLFEDQVYNIPKRPAILFENVVVTYNQVNVVANQIAHWARKKGLKTGDVVGLMMDNRPEFIMTWLGLCKLGIITSFVNFRLHGNSLKHILEVCDAKYFIVGPEHIAKFVEVYGVKDNVYIFKGKTGQTEKPIEHEKKFHLLDNELNEKDIGNPPMEWRRDLKFDGTLWYIFTSGTTGLPKAAKVTHRNIFYRSTILCYMTESTDADIVYCCLPLYHSSGSTVTLTMWHTGGKIALSRHFSSREFWNECRKFKATVFVYIGEICRYLLHQPEKKEDHKHQLRLAVGNGLRPDVWGPFQSRFKIPKIIEFYASTEGNTIINLMNKVGAVGYLPWFAQLVVKNNRIIKYDVEKDQYIKDKNGFCIECQRGEVGELIAKIETQLGSAVTSGGVFSGYTDKKATEKKILRDVFEKGDQYFRTGDLLKQDSEGYYYFVDRIGDTFRWKGENVSTTEVAEVIALFASIAESTVYGVTVPNSEGRAGMACVVLKPETPMDWKEFWTHLNKQLPPYAQPLFIRVTEEMAKTSTFKYTKTDLVNAAFNPTSVGKDALYFRDDSHKTFSPLTDKVFDKIIKGEIRL